jgi:iron uptake system EfeUOB component EfeO/EfeM
MSARGSLLAMTAAAALVTAVGCGHGAQTTATAPAAPPLSARNPVSGTIPTARPRDFRAPIAAYRRHVRSELTGMLHDVATLKDAVDGGDLQRARSAWLAADARYETIGAAYGAFGDLDAAINGRPAGLPRGAEDHGFTGLHRIELALWTRSSSRDARPFVTRLRRDVARLRRAVVHGLEIDPLEYSLRAHEVLEDTLHLQLSGQASSGSSDALVAVRANVAGTRVVVRSIHAMLVRRNPAIVREGERALDALDAAVDRLRRADGTFPRWDGLSQRERERIAGLTAAAAEQLAYIPELVDPRPPRPPVASSSGGTTR